MYICPTCKRKFEDAETIAKHSLRCWREKNPYHRSKPAPQSEDITYKNVSEDIMNFFASFEEKQCQK